MTRKWIKSTSCDAQPSQDGMLRSIAFNNSVLPLPGGPTIEQWLPARSFVWTLRVSSSRPSGSRLSA